MFFVLAKTILALLMPPASLIIMGVAGLIALKRSRRAGVALMSGSLALLYLLSTEPVANCLIRPLEEEYPPIAALPGGPEPVVVLSAGVKDLRKINHAARPSSTSLERLAAGIALRAGHRVPLVIAGGSGDPSKEGLSEADAMADMAVQLGVPRTQIVVENRSRNTLESSQQLASMLGARRVVLVTSAYHMGRSVALFEKQGFAVVPAPAAFLAERRSILPGWLLPRASWLAVSSTALQERASRMWHALSGEL